MQKNPNDQRIYLQYEDSYHIWANHPNIDEKIKSFIPGSGQNQQYCDESHPPAAVLYECKASELLEIRTSGEIVFVKEPGGSKIRVGMQRILRLSK